MKSFAFSLFLAFTSCSAVAKETPRESEFYKLALEATEQDAGDVKQCETLKKENLEFIKEHPHADKSGYRPYSDEKIALEALTKIEKMHLPFTATKKASEFLRTHREELFKTADKSKLMASMGSLQSPCDVISLNALSTSLLKTTILSPKNSRRLEKAMKQYFKDDFYSSSLLRVMIQINLLKEYLTAKQPKEKELFADAEALGKKAEEERGKISKLAKTSGIPAAIELELATASSLQKDFKALRKRAKI